jgi:hypothetical protein
MGDTALKDTVKEIELVWCLPCGNLAALRVVGGKLTRKAVESKK